MKSEANCLLVVVVFATEERDRLACATKEQQ